MHKNQMQIEWSVLRLKTCNKALFTPHLWSIERKICMDEGIKKKLYGLIWAIHMTSVSLTVSAMLFNAI